jgi:hypothetical protein
MDAAPPERQPALQPRNMLSGPHHVSWRARLVVIIVVVFSLLAVVAGWFVWRAAEYRRLQRTLDAAAAAVAQAERAESRILAPAAWKKASDALRLAMTELFAARRRFVLVRSYRRAQELLVAATAAAEEARGAATAARPREVAETPAIGARETRQHGPGALRDAQRLRDRARALIDELAGCPRKPRDLNNDLAGMRSNLGILDQRIAGVTGSVDSRPPQEVAAAAAGVRDSLQAMVRDLERMKTMLRCP